jgi:translocation and assembly module TamA
MLSTSFSTGSVFAQNIEINGVKNKEIISLIRTVILHDPNYSSEESKYFSLRFSKDITAIKDVLWSFGYFDADVKYETKNKKVIVYIDLKERYRFNDVFIKYIDNKEYSSGLKVRDVFDMILIKIGSYTNTKHISKASSNLLKFFCTQGFPFARMENPDIELDRKNKTFKIIFNIHLGEKVIMGKVKIVVKSETKDKKDKLEQFIRNRIIWQEGDIYNIDKIEETKSKIMETSMFDSVDVELAHPACDDHAIVCSDVIVTACKTSKLKNIAVGAYYGSNDGINATLAWELYNVDGRGSKFSTVTKVSKKLQSERLQYTMPDVIRKKDELQNSVYVMRENVEAYNVTKTGGESVIWNELFKSFNIGLGLSVEASKIKDNVIANSKYQYFKMIGVPVGFNFDTTENYLNPRSGIRASVMLVPHLSSNSFISANSKFSMYFPIFRDKHGNKNVVACYVKAASLLKSKNSTIPRDKYFFAGGANSVRAYGYQMLGELSSNGNPFGGSSSFEFGIEPRVMVNEDMEVVTFFEAGNVYDSKNPLMKGLMCGAGIGARYYTPLGPIRVDIAIPFKRRTGKDGKKIDSLFNLYIGVGQAF